MNITDRQLVDLARKSGICLPDCWNLDLYLNPESMQEDLDWINNSQNDSERNHRQEIYDNSKEAAESHLKSLRTFAELVISLTQQ